MTHRSKQGTATNGGKGPHLASLASSVGVPADQTAWLDLAVTHRSYTREQGAEERDSNERLEFLGDAVAQLVVSLMLYERYPRWTEGQLTRARSAVVSREPMYRAGMRLNLGNYLKLGKAEDEGEGRMRPSIVSSAFEAVIAAVYLTSGITAAEQVIRVCLDKELNEVESIRNRSDAKTHLQEVAQARFRQTPIYRTTDVSGPDHARVFTAEVLIDGQAHGSGVGASKKEAEQAAADQALANLEVNE
jgi:ribonuclease-3